jgi:hypothetical protein
MFTDTGLFPHIRTRSSLKLLPELHNTVPALRCTSASHSFLRTSPGQIQVAASPEQHPPRPSSLHTRLGGRDIQPCSFGRHPRSLPPGQQLSALNSWLGLRKTCTNTSRRHTRLVHAQALVHIQAPNGACQTTNMG